MNGEYMVNENKSVKRTKWNERTDRMSTVQQTKVGKVKTKLSLKRQKYPSPTRTKRGTPNGVSGVKRRGTENGERIDNTQVNWTEERERQTSLNVVSHTT